MVLSEQSSGWPRLQSKTPPISKNKEHRQCVCVCVYTMLIRRQILQQIQESQPFQCLLFSPVLIKRYMYIHVLLPYYFCVCAHTQVPLHTCVSG